MPSRRHPLGWYIAVTGLLVLAGLGFLFRQSIGRFIAARAIGYFAPRAGIMVAYSRITGDIFTKPTLHQLRIAYRGDSLACRSVEFSYDIFGFLGGRIPLSEVNIVGPDLFLALPKASQPGEGARPAGFPKLSLKRLSVVQARVFVNGEERADSLELSLSVGSQPEWLKAALYGVKGRLVKERVQLRHLSAFCVVTRDSLALDQLTVITGMSRMSGNLHLSLDGSSVAAQLDNVSVELGEFTTYPGRVRASGRYESRKSGPGTWSAELDYEATGLVLGSVGLPDIRGSLSLEDSAVTVELRGASDALGSIVLAGSLDLAHLGYSGSATMAGLRVRQLAGRLPDVRLDGWAGFSGQGTESLALDLHSSVRDLGLDSLVLAGAYRNGLVRVERLETRGRSGRAWFAGSFGHDALSVQGLLDSADLGLVEPFAGVRVAGRAGGVFSCSGSLESLAMSGGVRFSDFAAGPVSFKQGLAEFAMTFAHRFTGHAVVGCENARVGGFALSAAQVQFDGQDFDLRIDRLDDRLIARGRVELGRDFVQATVSDLDYSTAEESVVTGREFDVTWRPESLSIGDGRWQVAGGQVSAELAVRRAGGIRAAVDGSGLNLRKLQKLVRLPAELWGTVDFRLAGEDSFSLGISAQDLGAPEIGLAVKDLGLEASLSRSRARLDRLWFVHDVETTSVSGWLEYDSSGVRDLDLRAAIADPGPWVLFFLKQTLDLRDGKVYGQLALGGGFTEPNLVGRARVVDGRVFVPAVSTEVERVNAELTAGGSRVTVEKLSGGSGRGIVTASGFVDLGTDWVAESLWFRVRPDAASLSPLPQVFAVASADLVLAQRLNRPLFVSGTVHVEEALLAFGFGPSTPPPAATAVDSTVYDIRVLAERGVWLRNDAADIELAADFTLHRSATEELYTGQFTTRQGTLYYLDHTLQVTRGELRFDNISSLNPALDIVAELPVRHRQDRNAAPDSIVLSLGGTLLRPDFRLSAVPPVWDENQIITYLNLNVTPEELADIENRQAATRYLSERLLGYFQTQAAKRLRKFVGLDELRLESGLTGREGYRVTVGKYIGRDLYVTYSQGFSGTLQPAFTVEYFLSPRSGIVGAKSEEGRYSVRYRFRLKY